MQNILQFCKLERFQQAIVCSSAICLHHCLSSRIGRHQHHATVRSQQLRNTQKLLPIHAPHSEVHQDQIVIAGFQQTDSFGTQLGARVPYRLPFG